MKKLLKIYSLLLVVENFFFLGFCHGFGTLCVI